MKEIGPEIFIIPLTLLIFFSLSTSGQSASVYRCVNSKGSVLLTDNVPTDPDFKCTFSSSYRDRTPQEREQDQRDAQRIPAEYQMEAPNTATQEKDKIVELEKRRLKENKDHFKNRPPVAGDKSSEKTFRRMSEGYEKRMQELDNDPEYYFYKKQERERREASKPKSRIGTAIDPKTGRVIPGVIISP